MTPLAPIQPAPGVPRSAIATAIRITPVTANHSTSSTVSVYVPLRGASSSDRPAAPAMNASSRRSSMRQTARTANASISRKTAPNSSIQPMKIATVTEATAGTMIAIAPAITASQPDTSSHLWPCFRLSLSASCIRHLSGHCTTPKGAARLIPQLSTLCPFAQARELLPWTRVCNLRCGQPGASCGGNSVGARRLQRGDAMGVRRDDDPHAGVGRSTRVDVVEVPAVGAAVDLQHRAGTRARLDHALDIDRVRRARLDLATGQVADRVDRRVLHRGDDAVG